MKVRAILDLSWRPKDEEFYEDVTYLEVFFESDRQFAKGDRLRMDDNWGFGADEDLIVEDIFWLIKSGRLCLVLKDKEFQSEEDYENARKCHLKIGWEEYSY